MINQILNQKKKKNGRTHGTVPRHELFEYSAPSMSLVSVSLGFSFLVRLGF